MTMHSHWQTEVHRWQE